jgi:hypothetical protein
MAGEAFPGTGTDSTRDRIGVFLEHDSTKMRLAIAA